MRLAVNPVITTSVALVGASVIAVTPVEPPAPAVRVIESDVSLSASSLAYVPINMIQQVLSSPANLAAAMDRLAAAMVISGSWNENHANNQWGWDEANPAMLRELVNMAIPFPAFSEPWGRHLNWWATANLPMYEGCNYECPDLPGMLGRMFKVPMSEFYSDEGYTFPVVKTPFNGVETPWSQETVKLDPAEPLRSVWDSLTSEPTRIKTTTLWEFVTAAADLSAAMQITGHMPDWIAVREIERFFKHFLRPPAEDEELETPSGTTELALVSSVEPEADADAAVDDPVLGLSPAPVLRTLSLDTVGLAEEEPDEADEADEDSDASEDKAATKADSSAPSIVDAATNFLKGKFALSQNDVDTEDADAGEDAAESDSGDGDTAAKHRKADATDDSDSASDASDSGDSDDSDSGSSGSSGSGGSGGGDSDS